MEKNAVWLSENVVFGAILAIGVVFGVFGLHDFTLFYVFMHV